MKQITLRLDDKFVEDLEYIQDRGASVPLNQNDAIQAAIVEWARALRQQNKAVQEATEARK